MADNRREVGLSGRPPPLSREGGLPSPEEVGISID